MVKIVFHGDLGKVIAPEWNMDVSSVAEGLHSVEINTKKLLKYFLDKQKEGGGYRILINGEDCLLDTEEKNLKKAVLNSELMAKKEDLRTVDVIPVIEGAGPLFIPIIVALVVSVIAAVVTYLLAKPPTFEDFRDIETGGKVSYLFNGPYNVNKEGGPVPIGYGSLLVGSQVVGASYYVEDYREGENQEIILSNYSTLQQQVLALTLIENEADFRDADKALFLDINQAVEWSENIDVATLIRLGIDNANEAGWYAFYVSPHGYIAERYLKDMALEGWETAYLNYWLTHPT